MGKKSKKKTVASTRKTLKASGAANVKPKKTSQLLKKIFRKGKVIPPQKEGEVLEKNIPEITTKTQEAEIQPKKETELKAEEKAEHKVGHQKEKHIREKVHKESRLTDGQKQRLKGAVMIIIGIVLLAFAGTFVIIKLLRPQSIAQYLPANSTFGFAEVNIDGNSDQDKKLFKIFEKYPVYQSGNIIKLVELLLPVDYQKDLQPWVGRKAGIVLMKQSQDDDNVKMVLMVENRDQNKTLEFLKGRVLVNGNDQLVSEQYNGETLYRYQSGQSYNFTFINNYLVAAGNADLLKELVDAQGQNITKLRDDPNYMKVANNLPPGGLVFAYIDSNKLLKTILKNPVFQSQNAKDIIAMQPFLSVFSAMGISAVATDNNLSIQTFDVIDRSQLNGATYLTYSDKYQGKLLDLAEENPILFAGGHDLTKEIKRIGEIFNGATDTENLIFQGLLEAQKQKYFGKDISLNDDIYPLLQNEYLMTVENNFEEPVITVFLELSDRAKDMGRIEKIVNGFMKMSAIFSPVVREVTLPDGTKGEELVTSTEQISRTDNTYQGVTMTTLRLGNLPWSINYAVLDDNTFVVTTSPEALNAIIDRKIKGISAGLRGSVDFNTTVYPLLRSADEIFNIKLGALTEFLSLDQNEILKPYVEPLKSLTMAKNYFDDGISTTYVIDVL